VSWAIAGTGGIPVGTQAGSTITAAQSPCNSGSGDCTSTIQTALNSCGGTSSAQKFVQLGTGTFLINTGITVPAYCYLTGTGANTTILNAQGASTAAVACLGCGTGPSVANAKNVTSGATAGSTSLTLSSVTGIVVGTELIVSELNLWPWVTISGDAGGGNCTFCGVVGNWGPGDLNGNGETRTRTQIVEVTNVTGSVVTISIPLYTDYLHTFPSWAGTTQYGYEAFITAGTHFYLQTANITATSSVSANCTSSGTTPSFSTSGGSVSDGTCTWLDEGVGTTSQPQVIPFAATKFAGIENLQILANNTGYNTNVELSACAYCFVKGIENNYSDGDHVDIHYGYRDEVRDSYFSNTYSHPTGGGSFDGCINIDSGSTAFLIENNILERLFADWIVESGAAGGVIDYNYAFSNYAPPGTFLNPAMDAHASHTQFILIEGNVLPNITWESTWGSESHGTDFRNWIVGTSKACSPFTATRGTVNCTPAGYPEQAGHNGWFAYQASRIEEFNFVDLWFNSIGNVVGSSQSQALVNTGNTALTQTASITATSTRQYDTVVYGYSLGYAHASDDGTFPADSNAAATTLLIHGDYNNISSAITWSGSITHTLPASFFMTSQPSWWNANVPYPAIGPDVTGGTGPGGHVSSTTAANPAQYCYTAIMGGSDGGAASPLTFNASTCYARAASTATYILIGEQ
jgi:hypothetical protein